MNVSHLLAIGAAMISVSFAAAGSPATSPSWVQPKKSSSDAERAPAPCLVGTELCSAKNDPPKLCPVHAKSGARCPMDGFRVIEADSR
jgi:hypothetical protein